MIRIHFHYKGGPLDGKIVYFSKLPEDPSVPVLHKVTTNAKDTDIDLYAQGVYHLEQRGDEWVAVHHPGEEDQPFHEVKPTPVAEPEATVRSVQLSREKPVGRRPLEIPKNSRAGRRLAQIGEALLELERQRKERELEKKEES